MKLGEYLRSCCRMKLPIALKSSRRLFSNIDFTYPFRAWILMAEAVHSTLCRNKAGRFCPLHFRPWCEAWSPIHYLHQSVLLLRAYFGPSENHGVNTCGNRVFCCILNSRFINNRQRLSRDRVSCR